MHQLGENLIYMKTVK